MVNDNMWAVQFTDGTFLADRRGSRTRDIEKAHVWRYKMEVRAFIKSGAIPNVKWGRYARVSVFRAEKAWNDSAKTTSSW